MPLKINGETATREQMLEITESTERELEWLNWLHATYQGHPPHREEMHRQLKERYDEDALRTPHFVPAIEGLISRMGAKLESMKASTPPPPRTSPMPDLERRRDELMERAANLEERIRRSSHDWALAPNADLSNKLSELELTLEQRERELERIRRAIEREEELHGEE